MKNMILEASYPVEDFKKWGGGKATHLASMSQLGIDVPFWFCLSTHGFKLFLEENNLVSKINGLLSKAPQVIAEEIHNLFLSASFPKGLEEELGKALAQHKLTDTFLAVRSSGVGEDSVEHSFAGQYSSFLFQKGLTQIIESIKKCWASAYSERSISYRLSRGIPLENLSVGVVIQKMIHSEISGVAFSRNPVKPLDRENMVISSVWGQGEGLVSGILDADHFEVHRQTFKTVTHLVPKTEKLDINKESPLGGLKKEAVAVELQNVSSLTESQIKLVAQLTIKLEELLKYPQDVEWAISENTLYCLQTRPITSLPIPAFFDPQIKGSDAILWDNSNIVESYFGVTSPLTFSFANSAYRQVYIQFCEVMGVDKQTVAGHETVFRNMLGLIRGRIYYNLVNWYRLLLLLPGAGNNKGFMETMMGVKDSLNPEIATLFDFINNPPQHTLSQKLYVQIATFKRFWNQDQIVSTFMSHFDSIYQPARKVNFNNLSLSELGAYYQKLEDQILRRWQAPIINDFLCMIFFGLLKKYTAQWITHGDVHSSLQNDLLCGQGDLDSTEPTKTLMRIAQVLAKYPQNLKDEWLNTPTEQLQILVAEKKEWQEIKEKIHDFLDRFGFRCINELKLEEPDLHDDPTFIYHTLTNYLRSGSYSIHEMEEREKAIREKAQMQVRSKLSGIKLVVFLWIVKHARKSVKHRENMRFARTKIFGIARHIFRAMGRKLAELKVIQQGNDIFYLTVEEIQSYLEGRAITLNLQALVQARQKESEVFKKTPPPPDRFLTYGAVGSSLIYPDILAGTDLLASKASESSDPNTLLGTPCCPGIVEGVVRVAYDFKDAEGLNGEILVTERTDPGWVPLYPSCSGLLIERGSLLSHSAVVARELGLPTIVGISGGLLKKLKTGQRVRIDAGKGEVKILS